MNLRTQAKRAAKQAIQYAAAGVAPAVLGMRSGLIILMYHRVLPPDDPRGRLEQPGMLVQPDALRMQLRVIKRLCEPVFLSDWVHRASTGRPLPQRACAVTFDDGWRDNYEHALPVLKEERIPSTVFLVSDLVGGRRSFWPGRLAYALDRAVKRFGKDARDDPIFGWALPDDYDGRPLGKAYVDRLINRSKSHSDQEMNARTDRMMNALGGDEPGQPEISGWTEVREMAATGLVEFGSHTRHHFRMPYLQDAETLEDEVAGSKRVIEEQTGSRVRLFCYPNGDVTQAADAVVRKHYEGACTVASGWNRRSSDVHRLNRIAVHQGACGNEPAFVSRVMGWS